MGYDPNDYQHWAVLGYGMYRCEKHSTVFDIHDGEPCWQCIDEGDNEETEIISKED